jgi:2'-5' RNA ligase
VPAIGDALATVRSRFGVPWPDGLPSHVTVLYPFMPESAVDDAVEGRLADVLGTCPAFAFELAEMARFPGVLYVRPQPAPPFVTMTEAIVRAWPRYVPYEGQFRDVVPHVTVLDRSPEPDGLAAAVEALLPCAARADEVWLMAQTGDRWDRRAQVRLGSPSGA